MRGELIAQEMVKDKKHPCSRFGWGNIKSLLGENGDYESLWKDLRKFYET